MGKQEEKGVPPTDRVLVEEHRVLGFGCGLFIIEIWIGLSFLLALVNDGLVVKVNIE